MPDMYRTCCTAVEEMEVALRKAKFLEIATSSETIKSIITQHLEKWRMCHRHPPCLEMSYIGQRLYQVFKATPKVSSKAFL